MVGIQEERDHVGDLDVGGTIIFRICGCRMTIRDNEFKLMWEEAIVTKFSMVLLRGCLLGLRRGSLTEGRVCPSRYSYPVLLDALPLEPAAQ